MNKSIKLSIILAVTVSFLSVFFACGTDKDYIMTEFYVKNTSPKIITFDASVIKLSTITDPVEVFLSLTVLPNDSILARKTSFLKDGKEPQKWFNSFNIHPIEGIQMNDPNLPENWIRYPSEDIQIYVFTLNKN